MSGLLLVRYGELALKSPPVRREFERTLRRNILDLFVHERIEARLRSDRGHLYVETEDPGRAGRVLGRVFGVTSVSEVSEVPSEREAIRDRLLALAADRLRPGSRFAVRARRTGQHPFTSQELARDLGSDLLERFGDRALSVDLERPDVELFVEVRGPRTYLSFDRSAGPGGLPLGVAGRLVAYVDGVRAALGAFLMMKRGCRVAIVSSPAGAPYVRDVLARFDPKLSTVPVPPGPDAWSPVVEDRAEAVHADGIVLPLDVDEYPEARAHWGDRVVFSPTVGLTDQEVEDRWTGVKDLAA